MILRYEVTVSVPATRPEDEHLIERIEKALNDIANTPGVRMFDVKAVQGRDHAEP